MRDYKKIKAYQLADRLALDVYQLTKGFPKEELYGLTSQIRRAVVSVPTNIVEGSSRQTSKDYLNFLFIARASLSETEYLLNLSFKLKYLSEVDLNKINNILQETARTLFGLIEAVRKDI